MTTQLSGNEKTSHSTLFNLALDLGLPVAGYYAARLTGAAPALSLIIGIFLALARLVWVAVKHRRHDAIAGFTAAVLIVGLVISLISGDARWILVKESFGTGAAGIAIVMSALIGQPLVLSAVRSTSGEARRHKIDQRLTESPGFRRSFRVMTIIWGLGLIVEALLRVPLVFLLSPDVAVGLSQVLFFATIGVLIGWTIWYSRRVEQRTI